MRVSLERRLQIQNTLRIRMISDDLMEYIQKAVPLADAVPTELMKINLDSFTVEEMGDDLKSIALARHH